MVIKNPTREQFESVVSDGMALVDFWASWCAPCRAQTPIVEKLEEETDVKLVSVNVDEQNELAEVFRVASIPTLILYKDGVQIKKFVGFTSLAELKTAFGIK